MDNHVFAFTLLANKIESLMPHHRYLVQELVAQFYGDVEEE